MMVSYPQGFRGAILEILEVDQALFNANVRNDNPVGATALTPPRELIAATGASHGASSKGLQPDHGG